MFPKIAKNLPEVYNTDGSSRFIELHSATGQIISFLEGVLDVPDIKIERLNNEITLLKEKNLHLEELNKLTSESLISTLQLEIFQLLEKFRKRFRRKFCQHYMMHFEPTVQVATRHAYVFVGILFRAWFKNSCAKEGIKENGLNNQIEALISRKKIKQKHNQTLLDTVATLGHRSAHPTTEVFTKEKASLVLNGLLILIDEVFT